MIYRVKIFDKEGNLKKVCPAQSNDEILGSGISSYDAKNPFYPKRRNEIKFPSYNIPTKPPPDKEAVGEYSRPVDSSGVWDKEKDVKVIDHILKPYAVSGKKMAREIGVSYDTFRWRVKMLMELNNGEKSLNLARKRSRLDIDDKALVADLRDKSKKAKDLAKKYNVSPTTIWSLRTKISAA